MASADHVRATIQRALDKKGEGPITVTERIWHERNYLRDFLIGKKRSINTEFAMALAAYLDIEFNDLVITRPRRLRRAS